MFDLKDEAVPMPGGAGEDVVMPASGRAVCDWGTTSILSIEV